MYSLCAFNRKYLSVQHNEIDILFMILEGGGGSVAQYSRGSLMVIELMRTYRRVFQCVKISENSLETRVELNMRDFSFLGQKTIIL